MRYRQCWKESVVHRLSPAQFDCAPLTHCSISHRALPVRSTQQGNQVPVGTSGVRAAFSFEEEIVYSACPKPLGKSIWSMGVGQLSLCSQALLLPLGGGRGSSWGPTPADDPPTHHNPFPH